MAGLVSLRPRTIRRGSNCGKRTFEHEFTAPVRARFFVMTRWSIGPLAPSGFPARGRIDKASSFSYHRRMRFPLAFAATVASVVTSLSLAQAADAPPTFEAGDFKFTRPSGWEWVPNTSPMRKAQLKVNDPAKKESAEVVFFHFGEGGGGGTQANIDRWLGQFQEPREKLNSKIETGTAAGRKVTYVQAEGTYLSGMPGGSKTPQPGTVLLGAIMESDKGNVFIRLTGPAKLATSARADFRKMVESASIVR